MSDDTADRWVGIATLVVGGTYMITIRDDGTYSLKLDGGPELNHSIKFVSADGGGMSGALKKQITAAIQVQLLGVTEDKLREKYSEEVMSGGFTETVDDDGEFLN